VQGAAVRSLDTFMFPRDSSNDTRPSRLSIINFIYMYVTQPSLIRSTDDAHVIVLYVSASASSCKKHCQIGN